MSNLINVRLWKEKAKIDYIPPFMSLWVSLNAWMKNRFEFRNERQGLEKLKGSPSSLFDKFSELIDGKNINAILFRRYFAELHRALLTAYIPYQRNSDKTISFKCCMVEYRDGNPRFESILAEDRGDNSSIKSFADQETIEDFTEFNQADQEIIDLDGALKVASDSERLFIAYIEIVYQVRCALFHGDLSPISEEDKRVVQQLYLTLSMVMENI